MKWPLKERISSAALLIPAVLMVSVLAVLQYRWINQVSDATSLRLAASLQQSIIEWHQELFRDLSQICFVFAVDSQNAALTDSQRFTRTLDQWQSITPYPDLISGLYVVGPSPAGPALLHFNPTAQQLEPVPWPANLKQIHDDLLPNAEHPAQLLREKRRVNGFYPGGVVSGWQFEPSAPALLHPITRIHGDDPDVHRWLLVAINSAVLRSRVMPDLSQRFFQGTNGLDFQVSVLGGQPSRPIYSSDHDFGAQEIADADGSMNLFGRGNNATPSVVHVFHNTPSERAPITAPDVLWFPLFSDMPASQDWQLFVRHRQGGSLGAFAAELHRRDMALSIGILVLLSASMAMLLISARRAQHLARLQMEFVTTVSHELRTPLTVIGTAADNITSGIVDSKPQMLQYGALIQTQVRQLAALTEQVLMLASTRQGRLRYNHHPIQVAEVVQNALAGIADLSAPSEFTVDQQIQSPLPAVRGDFNALSQCLQNLINNALKYSTHEKWLGITARLDPASHEIEIRVRDHGMGIAPADLPHIFEPFYRGSSAIAERIRGTGLGLALAKGIADAMKGQLTVSSIAGEGSVFTLRLPCIAPSETLSDTAA